MGAYVVLLTAEERAKNLRLLSDKFGNSCHPNNLGHNYNMNSHGPKGGTRSNSASLSMKISSSGTSNLKRSRSRPLTENRTPKTKSNNNSTVKRGTTPKRS